MKEGKQYLESGQLRAAESSANRVLMEKPDSSAGLMLFGDIHMKKGEVVEAIDCYVKAHQANKIYLDPLKKLVDAYEQIEQSDLQMVCLQKLDKISPLNAERKADIGILHVMNDDVEQAQQFFDKAISLAKKQAMDKVSDLGSKIASILQNDNPELAEYYIDRAIRAKGNNLSIGDIGLFNKRGMALRTQGKFDEAIKNYERALQLSNRDAALYYNKGLACLEGRRDREALKCFERAIDVEPDFYRSGNNAARVVGVHMASMGVLTKEVMTILEFAHKVRPDSNDVKKALDNVYKALGMAA